MMTCLYKHRATKEEEKERKRRRRRGGEREVDHFVFCPISAEFAVPFEVNETSQCVCYLIFSICFSRRGRDEGRAIEEGVALREGERGGGRENGMRERECGERERE